MFKGLNDVFHIQRVFNSHSSHVWPEANPLAVSSIQYHQQHSAVNVWAGVVHVFFDWTSLVTPTAQGTGLPGVCGGKSYLKCWKKSRWHSGETCGSSTTGLRLTLAVRSENISPPFTTIAGLEGAGLWFGLSGHRTSHQWTSSYGATLTL